MQRTLKDLLARAASGAGAAATRADVEVVPLADAEAIAAASRLFDRIWGEESQLPANVLRALIHAGNHAAGAWAGGRLVGALVGFLGIDDEGPYLHSHILGVDPGHQGSSVGTALKLHQRAWAIERGLGTITWTFDPLVRRNAYFNLGKLGARAGSYHERFYGEMRDGINAGDESDRLLVSWDLADERAEGELPSEPPANGHGLALRVEGDEPRLEPVDGRRIWCATPEDIFELRARDPELALRWRRALRSTLGRAMSDGYRVVGFTRSGCYVLDAP